MPPTKAGPFTVEFCMHSTFTGVGQVFWRSEVKPSYVGKTVNFTPEPDGKPHTYTVTIPAKSPLRGLRLDPGTSAGEAHLLWLRLKDAGGKMLKEWQYAQ